MVTIFLAVLMFDQVFFLPQAKQSVIFSNKHGIYELSHNFSTNLGP